MSTNYDGTSEGGTKVGAIVAGVLIPLFCIGACVAAYCYIKIRHLMIATKKPPPPKPKSAEQIEVNVHNID